MRKHFWGVDHGVRSTGNITDEMVNEYLESHRSANSDNSNFILEHKKGLLAPYNKLMRF
ncbi:hypothetical protein [Tenacibaculum sp. SDUM215027]|uniref:hypothetical protein n=1 Tax=Tenacibaculum sp. SDUM215027 TaxID=3422596 RepID=UPI003D312591